MKVLRKGEQRGRGGGGLRAIAFSHFFSLFLLLTFSFFFDLDGLGMA